jgi:ElaB/YqjD/DUF883 family membrane-anchored ribosome-binding protein
MERDDFSGPGTPGSAGNAGAGNTGNSGSSGMGAGGGLGSGGLGNSGNTLGSQGYGGSGMGAGSTGGSYADRDVSDLGDKAGQAREKLADVGSDLRDRAADMGSGLRDRAATAKSSLADALESGANKLRGRSADSMSYGGDGAAMALDRSTVDGATDRLAGGMQETADWLRENDLDSMRTGIERQVRQNPGSSMLIAVGIGYLLGKALRR